MLCSPDATGDWEIPRRSGMVILDYDLEGLRSDVGDLGEDMSSDKDPDPNKPNPRFEQSIRPRNLFLQRP